jgi:hypothetical protein
MYITLKNPKLTSFFRMKIRPQMMIFTPQNRGVQSVNEQLSAWHDQARQPQLTAPPPMAL